MRAMVFGADADKLIVAATASEVRRYAVGQAVDVHDRHEAIHALVEQGWDIVPTDEKYRYQMQPFTDKPVAKCILKTLCGCTQERWADYPWPRDFRFPICEIGAMLAAPLAPLENVAFKVRRFEQVGMNRYESGAIEITYLETV